MPYLTYDEYIDLGLPEIGETEFNRLLPKASDVVDSVTRSFYKFNDMDSDVPFRREQFKKAVAAQIQYFHDMGGVSSHELNEAQTVTIGRTTVSTSNRNSSQEEQKNKLISDDVFMYLRYTGLLYRGVAMRL